MNSYYKPINGHKNNYNKMSCCSKLISRYGITFPFFMTILSTYLVSNALELSPYIKTNHHYEVTVFSYAYNLIYIQLVCYFLFTFGKIIKRHYVDSFTYWLFSHLGAIGFALLGEVPSLENIVIVPGFWKHLNGEAWITIISFTVIIGYLAIQEMRVACLDRSLNFIKILLVAFGYFIILGLLIATKAQYILFHVHHAIFAGVLSLWFTDWNYRLAEIMHAILIGVVVEGISFYGIGELSLFLTTNSQPVEFNTALLLSVTVLFVSLIYYFTKWIKSLES